MVIYSEQIDHQGHLIVFWSHFIQFSTQVTVILLTNTPIILKLDTKYFSWHQSSRHRSIVFNLQLPESRENFI